MAIREYVGARYVPRFMGTFDATQQYEVLDVVDNGLGTSYILKKPAPVNTPVSDSDYWALYGASSGGIINLQNQIGSLPSLSTTDQSNLVAAINEVFNNVVTLSKTVLNPKEFGAECDQDTDDSAAMQSLFDYAAANKITEVNFDGISEISFKNVQIKSDVNINVGSCKIYGIASVDERVSTLLKSTTNDISIAINGGEFIGKDVTHGYNPTPTNGESLFEFLNARYIKISNGYYHNLNNRNDPLASDSDYTNRRAILFTIHDCKYTEITNNVFDHIYGEEGIYVMNKTLDRKDMDCVFSLNSIKNCTTSTFDFIGNYCEMFGNTYNYDYAGSIINCFALNAYIHDEKSLGVVANLYDNCEKKYFQSDIVKIENIYCYAAREFADLSAKNISIKNVIHDHMYTSGAHTFCYVNKGFGGTSLQHPNVASSELPMMSVVLENIDISAIDGNMRMFWHGDALTAHSPMVAIKNCKFNKSTAQTPAHCFIAVNCDLTIDGCVIPMRLDTNFSAVDHVAIVIQSFDAPRRMIISNNIFVNSNPNSYEYALHIGNIPVVFVGNTAVANTNDYIQNTTPATLVNGVNQNFITA